MRIPEFLTKRWFLPRGEIVAACSQFISATSIADKVTRDIEKMRKEIEPQTGLYKNVLISRMLAEQKKGDQSQVSVIKRGSSNDPLATWIIASVSNSQGIHHPLNMLSLVINTNSYLRLDNQGIPTFTDAQSNSLISSAVNIGAQLYLAEQAGIEFITEGELKKFIPEIFPST